MITMSNHNKPRPRRLAGAPSIVLKKQVVGRGLLQRRMKPTKKRDERMLTTRPWWQLDNVQHASTMTTATGGTKKLVDGTPPGEDEEFSSHLTPSKKKNPLASFQTYGWVPDEELSEDENLMDLVLLITRTSKLREGSMCCILLNPPDNNNPSDDDHKNNGELHDHSSLLNRIVTVTNNQSLFMEGNSDVHAEIVALATAARYGVSTEGLTAYITMPPCKRCFAALLLAGVNRIVSRYAPSVVVQTAAEQHGLELVTVGDTPIRRERLKGLVEQHHSCCEPELDC